jgi:tetraacyldisaccharide 4'-kinase
MQMIKYLRFLLFPISIVYGLVISIRNKFYDSGFFKSVHFDLPVICVGNLVVGGSGKSPVTEYLVELLSNYKIAILSRGYGRNTKGFLLADTSATAMSIGDEPMQFYRKFPQVTVAVCEDRVKGIKQLAAAHDLIILDDAFQHRAVSPGFSILLFEFSKLMKNQYLLPAGNLRESFTGYHRADAILITKSPEVFPLVDKQHCLQKFDKNTLQDVSFSTLSYGNLIPFSGGLPLPCANVKKGTVVFLLTGIANPKPLTDYLSAFQMELIHHDYSDHHQFTKKEILRLIGDFKNHRDTEKIIITTEKDVQRLLHAPLQELLLDLPVFYLPVKIKLQTEDQLNFNKKILDYVSIVTRDRTIH